MAETSQRKYAFTDSSVELRARGWFFGRQYDPPVAYRGPHNSIASVTLMIARQLRREVERRDGAANGRSSARSINETPPPF